MPKVSANSERIPVIHALSTTTHFCKISYRSQPLTPTIRWVILTNTHSHPSGIDNRQNRGPANSKKLTPSTLSPEIVLIVTETTLTYSHSHPQNEIIYLFDLDKYHPRRTFIGEKLLGNVRDEPKRAYECTLSSKRFISTSHLHLGYSHSHPQKRRIYPQMYDSSIVSSAFVAKNIQTYEIKSMKNEKN